MEASAQQKRTVGIVTVGRSDYGIYRPLLRRLEKEESVRLLLYATGMHLAPEFGRTVTAIEQDGFSIAERIDMLVSSDSAEGISKSVGLGVIGFAQVFSRCRPDLLVVCGDRFEMHAAALAALPFRIPVAHLHGGELTQGAMDDALRHSLTKLSHLHFVATEEYAQRVRQLGEEPWRVKVCGALSLDQLSSERILSRAQLEESLGFTLQTPCLLVTYHPVTLQCEKAEWHSAELLRALEECNAQIIFTLPNADTGGRKLAGQFREFVTRTPRARLVENLGTQRYFSLMRQVSAMVGNSSSGLIEAASFELPVVNVGQRQAGRVRGENVLDVAEDQASILRGIRIGLDPKFRASLQGKANPYYKQGNAAEIIAEALASAPLDDRLVCKAFYNLPQGSRSTSERSFDSILDDSQS